MTNTIKLTLSDQNGSSVYTLNTDDLPKSVVHRVLVAAIEANIQIGSGDLVAIQGTEADATVTRLANAINLMESYAKHQPV